MSQFYGILHERIFLQYVRPVFSSLKKEHFHTCMLNFLHIFLPSLTYVSMLMTLNML